MKKNAPTAKWTTHKSECALMGGYISTACQQCRMSRHVCQFDKLEGTFKTPLSLAFVVGCIAPMSLPLVYVYTYTLDFLSLLIFHSFFHSSSLHLYTIANTSQVGNSSTFFPLKSRCPLNLINGTSVDKLSTERKNKRKDHVK